MVHQAESSASRRRGGASELPTAPPQQDREASVRPEPARALTANKAPSVHDHLGNQREPQGGHDVVSRRWCHNNEATTRTEAVATIVGRTTVLPSSHLALESLARPSAAPRSPSGFGNRPTSQSTTVRPTLSFGWPINAWLVSWAVRTMICSSSATSRCSY